MVQGKYPTAFPLKHQQKDMRLALEAAAEGGMALPVAAAANGMYVKVSPAASASFAHEAMLPQSNLAHTGAWP